MSIALKPERTRRLSPLRLSIAVIATAAIVTGGIFWGRVAISDAVSPTVEPWFAGYVDVTTTPSFAFETPTQQEGKNVVLSFIVSSPHDACDPSWGGAYSLDEAGSSLDLDRRIARLEQQKGEAIVSFGGQANSELSINCTDAASLEAAYASVVDRYTLSTVDMDLEGNSLTTAAVSRGSVAIAAVQKSERASGHELAVWLTLPVTPAGLSEDGTNAVAAYLAAGVDVAGVNAMTMDYGSSLAKGTSMTDGSIAALNSVHRQLGVLYTNAKIPLTAKTLWSKIGVTPMIGQNDTPGEVFSLKAASAINAFALGNGLGRVSMWSLNRDQTCGPNYVDLTTVSTACSGVDQGDSTFAADLGKGVTGLPELSSAATTSPEPVETVKADDPATSPYAIWSEGTVYLAGTKTVWHHNVYLAKWWTKGDVPDSPVLQSSDTPWTLIGPVLPGEKPIVLASVPADTYPSWSGDKTYTDGDRVMLNGIAYEAKWWTQGDSPEASSQDPDSSPWSALTQKQILTVLDAAN